MWKNKYATNNLVLQEKSIFITKIQSISFHARRKDQRHVEISLLVVKRYFKVES